METQNPVVPQEEFQLGSAVVYGMHGKCSVIGIETRVIGEETIRFYKLEVFKSALSRSSRKEPAIWVPVAKARETGLRPVMNTSDADACFRILENREYYFQIAEPWHIVQPKLEATIRNEGAIGLSKVLSYLTVLKRKQIVPSSDVTKTTETVLRLLVREISDVLNQQGKTVEERIHKLLKHKLLPDN